MLLWADKSRYVAGMLAVTLFALVYGLPIGVIALASISGQWNGVLPEQLSAVHYLRALQGESAAPLRASIVTAALTSTAALIYGTWAALAVRNVGAHDSRLSRLSRRSRRLVDMVFFLPSALPSVSIGLGLLVAFSQPPLRLNGTPGIVFIAHFVIVSAFCYGSVSAGLARLPRELDQMAQSLGARPFYRLCRVTLPLLAPSLSAALSLGFALSMGELGATLLVYPPGWTTLPVGIFALSDRGAIFDAAALAMLLGATTLLVVLGLSRLAAKAAGRL